MSAERKYWLGIKIKVSLPDLRALFTSLLVARSFNTQVNLLLKISKAVYLIWNQTKIHKTVFSCCVLHFFYYV